MDQKALFRLEYGVFMVASKEGERVNGCITNTCIQSSSSPVTVAIACINANYTRELIEKSGYFTVSVLDKSVTFDTIKHFGMQSGRKVDKFATFKDYALDENGIPYLTKQANAVLSCKVISSENLGSHTLFIGQVEDAKLLSDKDSITYAEYRVNVKPSAQAKPDSGNGKKIIGWRCRICKYVYKGAELPADYICPICGHPAEDFEPIYEE